MLLVCFPLIPAFYLNYLSKENCVFGALLSHRLPLIHQYWCHDSAEISPSGGVMNNDRPDRCVTQQAQFMVKDKRYKKNKGK